MKKKRILFIIPLLVGILLIFLGTSLFLNRKTSFHMTVQNLEIDGVLSSKGFSDTSISCTLKNQSSKPISVHKVIFQFKRANGEDYQITLSPNVIINPQKKEKYFIDGQYSLSDLKLTQIKYE